MLGKSKLECSDNEGTKTLNSEHYCGVKFQEMMRKSKQICSDNRVLSKPYYLNKLVLIFSSILLGGNGLLWTLVWCFEIGTKKVQLPSDEELPN